MARKTATAASAAPETDDTPDRHVFKLVAVWPNGHGLTRYATARELHAAKSHWEQGGALVVVSHEGERAKAIGAETGRDEGDDVRGGRKARP